MKNETTISAIAKTLDVELNSENLVFPTMFNVSMRIKEAVERDDVDFFQLAMVIQSEPMLTARLLRVANSTLYNPENHQSNNLIDAMRRIGLLTVRTIALSVANQQIAQDLQDKNLQILASGLWLRSIQVATLASAVAESLRFGQSPTVLFTGMLTSLADFYILSRCKELNIDKEDEENFKDFANAWHPTIQKQLFKALEIPHTIANALTDSLHFDCDLNALELGDIMVIAESLCHGPHPLDRALVIGSQARVNLERFTRDDKKIQTIIELAEEKRKTILQALG